MTYESYFKNLDAQIGVIEAERDEARRWARHFRGLFEKLAGENARLRAELEAARRELAQLREAARQHGGLTDEQQNKNAHRWSGGPFFWVACFLFYIFRVVSR